MNESDGPFAAADKTDVPGTRGDEEAEGVDARIADLLASGSPPSTLVAAALAHAFASRPGEADANLLPADEGAQPLDTEADHVQMGVAARDEVHANGAHAEEGVQAGDVHTGQMKEGAPATGDATHPLEVDDGARHGDSIW